MDTWPQDPPFAIRRRPDSLQIMATDDAGSISKNQRRNFDN